VNGAANCPECYSRMTIKATNHGAGLTFRIAECDCGERWELEERRARRLRPCTAVHSGDPPPTAANPSVSAGGEGGGVSGDRSGQDSDPNPIASESPKRARARSNRKAETPAFVAFYELFPRKSDRPASMRAWLAKDCEHISELVMAGLRRWLPDFSRREPDKVPHPATWLNGERWNDPVPAPPKQQRIETFAQRAEREREERLLEDRAFGVGR
jgi:hypothetical protein